LKDALKDAKLVSVLKGVACMDVEIKRALDFLQISTDLRQLQRPADVRFRLFLDKSYVFYLVGFETKNPAKGKTTRQHLHPYTYWTTDYLSIC
jgi:hypothetical protein